MNRTMIRAGLVLAMVLFTGCSEKKSSSQPFRIILTDMSSADKQQLKETLSEEASVEILEANESAAVDMIRKGEADCAYGIIRAENAVHYGILKSEVIRRKEMLLVSDKQIQHANDMEHLIVGYMDILDEPFLRYLQMVPDIELHAYLSETQLIQDLKSGLLDLAAAESDTAFQILESDADSWQISQPFDMPVLEYRFFACTQEALVQAEAFRKEN